MQSYRIQPPGRRLAELAPLIKKAHAIIRAAAAPLGLKAPNLKDLAEQFTGRISGPLKLLPETSDPQRAYGTALVALREILIEAARSEKDRWGGLRQVLLLKSQFLWVCEEHANPTFAVGAHFGAKLNGS